MAFRKKKKNSRLKKGFFGVGEVEGESEFIGENTHSPPVRAGIETFCLLRKLRPNSHSSGAWWQV